MGSVTSIGRRLAALEARRGASLTHLSDEELGARVAVLDARLVAALAMEGFAVPHHLRGRDRDAWIAARVRELAA